MLIEILILIGLGLLIFMVFSIYMYIKTIASKIDSQRVEIEQKIDSKIETLRKDTNEFRKEQKDELERIRDKIDERLAAIQSSNERKLDDIRVVVDEKLQKTLENRLQKSFETIGVQLESVHKGVGEVKSVADEIGSLKRALAGSKTKGIFGEVRLKMILEDILPPSLYDEQVAVKKGSSERVDYVVKLPGTLGEDYVFLPIDSKFPLEDYESLTLAYENGDKQEILDCQKKLRTKIKDFGTDIKKKYVNPPITTNFAVMFLPTEGLYSEVVRDTALFDDLRKNGIMIAGPVTFSAFLNSLQVGFKTLQIQKNAVEIEKTLGAVKLEFENFAGVLDKTQKKIGEASQELEKLVGTRTNKINSSLKNIQVYTGDDVTKLLE